MKYTLILGLLVILTQCAGKKISKQLSLNGEWILEELVGYNDTITGYKGNPTLVIDLENSRYRGYSGCNNYSGELIHSNNKLTLKPGLMTRMACMDNGLEEAFISALESVTSYTIKDRSLVLTRTGSAIATFSQKE